MRVGSLVMVINNKSQWWRYEGTVVSMKHGIIKVVFASDPDNEHSFTREDLEVV